MCPYLWPPNPWYSINPYTVEYILATEHRLDQNGVDRYIRAVGTVVQTVTVR